MNADDTRTRSTTVAVLEPRRDDWTDLLSERSMVGEDTLGSPSGLTRSELQIAIYAAVGRSNRQIAGHMFLSVRTVESHLLRAYEKLGVSGRHSLASALGIRITVDLGERDLGAQLERHGDPWSA